MKCINYKTYTPTLSAVKATAFLTTPDPELQLNLQVSQTRINNLPNPLVLKNQYFEMFYGLFAKRVFAKADFTYQYTPQDPEFAAVSIFLSLEKQIELYLKCGLRPPKQPMFVVINDPLVNDNAYFEPERYEIHIGVGSGVDNGGLNEQFVFDLGVANHEFAHAAVYLQTVNGDLLGKYGAALNEALGDVLGTTVMYVLGKIQLAKQSGKTFTFQDLQADPLIIGTYALPPFGIRTVKNQKRFPNDLSGEPHADGLIIGGALADLFLLLSSKGDCLERQIKLFVKLILKSLTLLPGHKVTFTDMLKALMIADRHLFSGKNRRLIQRAFRKHGIVLDTSLTKHVLPTLESKHILG